jgi:nucleotide-binding universal stress UspA family protein
MYRNILLPVDLGRPESWQEALSAVSPLAECFDAELTICSVVSDLETIKSGEWLPISVEQKLFDARARLEGLAAGAPGDRSWGVEVTAGSVAGGILEIAERLEADLIVLIAHQPATLDYFRAANAIRVASRAKCSVLIARQGRA